MSLRVEQFRTGGDRNFGYLCVDEASGEAFAVDPSNSPGMLADYAAGHGWTVRYAFCTHGHQDHCNGNEEFERLTGVRVLLFGDRCEQAGTKVADNEVFPLGGSGFSIVHTPGHTEDSICILAGDSVFTGDTLFVGKVGGTWSDDDARLEYRSLHERLMRLPEAVRVFPGHDYGTSPVSTIGQEKRSNPFLQQPGVDAFLDLKRNWAAYKKEHGIS
jgi:hydroxyacylglutathione hydrolase